MNQDVFQLLLSESGSPDDISCFSLWRVVLFVSRCSIIRPPPHHTFPQLPTISQCVRVRVFLCNKSNLLHIHTGVYSDRVNNSTAVGEGDEVNVSFLHVVNYPCKAKISPVNITALSPSDITMVLLVLGIGILH